MKSFALATGSSGNCIYVESKLGVKILVDFGISFTKTKEILNDRDIDIKDIDAVFITHEHADHILGLETLIKKTKIPIYMSKGTFDKLRFIDSKKIIIVKNHQNLEIKDLKIFSISKPHDALEALSFIFDDGIKLGVFTDLGHVNDEIKHVIKTLDIVYMEANYCEKHISKVRDNFNSNYLNRLMSNVGHLGLHQTCDALCDVAQNKQKIILSHISENTNTYTNAYLQVKNALNVIGVFPEIFVSFQGESTDWFE